MRPPLDLPRAEPRQGPRIDEPDVARIALRADKRLILRRNPLGLVIGFHANKSNACQHLHPARCRWRGVVLDRSPASGVGARRWFNVWLSQKIAQIDV
jgi:hypothetical protein